MTNQPDKPSKLPLIATAPLLLVLLLHTTSFFWQSWSKVAYPYPLEVGEGEVLNYAVMSASDQTLYAPVEGRQATICNYPPVSFFLLGLITNPEKPSFTPGRLLAVMMASSITLLLLVLLLKRGAPWWLAGTVSLLFLANPVVYPFASLLRVDVIALAISFLGLAVFLLVPGRAGLVFTVFIFVAALFTKHSSIFAPLAVTLYLLVNDRKRLVWFLLMMGAFGGGLLAVAHLVTDGQFLKHLLVYTYEGYDPSRIMLYIQSRILWPPYTNALLLIAAGILWLGWARRGGLKDPCWYYLPASVPSLLLLGKFGSSAMYLQELFLASILTVGVALAHHETAGRDEEIKSSAYIVPLVTLPLAALFFLQVDQLWQKPISAKQYQQDQSVNLFVRSAKKPIFAEDIGLLVINGQRPQYPNTYSLTWAIENGMWDPSPLLEDIRDKRLAFLLLGSDAADPGVLTSMRVHPAILKGINAHYPRKIMHGGTVLHFPKESGLRRKLVPVKPAPFSEPEQVPLTEEEKKRLPDWIDPSLVVPGGPDVPAGNTGVKE